MGTLEKKMFQTFGKTRKKQIWGRCWVNIGLRKTQPHVWFEAARDSESLTDIDQQN